MSLFTLPVYLTAPTLAEGTCWPATPQELVNDIFAAVQAQIEASINPGMFSQGSDVPDVDSRIYPWLRTAGDSLDGWYTFSGTHSGWIRPNPEESGSDVRRIFVGSTLDLQTYDGGDTNASGEASGPMWEVDTVFATRMPVGVGTLPISSTVVAVNATGGEEKHELTAAENGPHTHDILQWDGPIGGATSQAMLRVATVPVAVAPDYVTETSGGDPLNSHDPVAHNNMPPYIGVYFIKRTSRKYYCIAP